MKIFILAGGKGSRFFPFSSVIPKCLLPVAGKPCIRWIVEDAIKQGYPDIVLCINRKDEKAFRHEFRDLSIGFSISEDPQGTVGEILCAKKLITETFLLRYGDDLTEVNYTNLLEFHKKRRGLATVAVTTQVTLPVGIIKTYTESSYLLVELFEEKPMLNRFAWTGMVVLEPEAIQFFRFGEDIAKHTIPKMLREDALVFAFDIKSEWFDVGNVEHWRRANKHYLEKQKCE